MILNQPQQKHKEKISRASITDNRSPKLTVGAINSKLLGTAIPCNILTQMMYMWTPKKEDGNYRSATNVIISKCSTLMSSSKRRQNWPFSIPLITCFVISHLKHYWMKYSSISWGNTLDVVYLWSFLIRIIFYWVSFYTTLVTFICIHLCYKLLIVRTFKAK